VPEGLGFFDGFWDVVEFYRDFEFAPASFGDGEGLPIDGVDGYCGVSMSWEKYTYWKLLVPSCGGKLTS
jgi:hypothetical protein